MEEIDWDAAGRSFSRLIRARRDDFRRLCGGANYDVDLPGADPEDDIQVRRQLRLREAAYAAWVRRTPGAQHGDRMPAPKGGD